MDPSLLDIFNLLNSRHTPKKRFFVRLRVRKLISVIHLTDYDADCEWESYYARYFDDFSEVSQIMNTLRKLNEIGQRPFWCVEVVISANEGANKRDIWYIDFENNEGDKPGWVSDFEELGRKRGITKNDEPPELTSDVKLG